MYHLGLKLFSVNTDLLQPAAALLEEGVFSYIELYAPPQMFSATINVWKSLTCPWVIHAPHFGNGVNLADSTLKKANETALLDSRRFADALHATSIIVHGGFGGSLDEVCQQITELRDGRFILENTPRYGIDGQICVGYTPEHMKFAVDSGAFTGFVLDMGHAVYAANALHEEIVAYLERFIKLGPSMLHVADGEWNETRDVHHRIGRGNFDLATMCALLPAQARMTLEIPRDSGMKLQDAKEDAIAFRRLLPAAC